MLIPYHISVIGYGLTPVGFLMPLLQVVVVGALVIIVLTHVYLIQCLGSFLAEIVVRIGKHIPTVCAVTKPAAPVRFKTPLRCGIQSMKLLVFQVMDTLSGFMLYHPFVYGHHIGTFIFISMLSHTHAVFHGS